MKPPNPDRNRPYRHDKTVADDFIQPTNRITSLMHNIFNMRVAQHSIGSKVWIDSALAQMRKYGFEELNDVIGTPLEPIVPFFIAKRTRPELQKWATARSGNATGGEYHQFPHPATRVRNAVDVISTKPLPNCAFATVVTSVQLSYWDALAAAKTDGDKLVQLLNRRLRVRGRKFSFIMVPEVDLLTVEQIDDGLMGSADWKTSLQPNQVVYKVHFHGVLYVEGHSVKEIETAFQRTNNGRRTKVFSGQNRTRVVPLYKDPQQGDRNDAAGCVGYSLKQHYRPTYKERHFENMPEWLRLMADMDNRPSLIRTGGIYSK